MRPEYLYDYCEIPELFTRGQKIAVSERHFYKLVQGGYISNADPADIDW
jgi:hypothetical protein